MLKARLYSVRGELFTLAFGRTYCKIASQDEVHIERVVFHVDVMQPVSETLSLSVREGEEAQLMECLTQWCTELGHRWAIEQVLPPLSPEERQQRLQEVEASLPMDHLNLIQACDGFRIADAVVWSLSDIREVYLPSGAYYLMAERGGGYWVFWKGSRMGMYIIYITNIQNHLHNLQPL